jgi:hypothetical protein
MKIVAVTVSLLSFVVAAFAESVIVDNIPSAPHVFTTVGSWPASTALPGHYGANYAEASGPSSATASWQPSIATSGVYKIYMKWTASAARADRVPVEIKYDNGNKTDSTRRLNQRLNGGSWVYLGAYFLGVGTNNSVQIEAGDAGSACADAVLFELSHATPASPVEPALTTPRTDFSIIERPDAAPLTVYYTNGTKSVVVYLNQTTNSGQWVSAGTYYLAAGTGSSLKLNATDQGVVAADAVKFEMAADTNVTVVVDNELPAGSPHAFTMNGTWPAATSPSGFYGTNYFHNPGSQSTSAVRWRPYITNAGDYNIYIRWPGSLPDDRPQEVQIVRTDSGEAGVSPVFELRIEGGKFHANGSCGHEAVGEIAAAGGNAIRTYSINAVSPDFLRGASDAGIKVVLGLWLTQAEGASEGFYDDPASVSNQLAVLKSQINSYKDFEAVLGWGIGNEIDPITMTNPEPVYKAIQQVARYIREVDHYHPSLTVHAGSNTNKFLGVRQWAPDVDIIGVNSYEPNIANITPNLVAAGWNGPAFITEFFLRTPFSAGTNSWGAVIEPVSADKYTGLLSLYADDILPQTNRCFGAFVFKGSQGAFRVTHTWYPILDENLKPTPSYDAMRENWGGPAAPGQIAPQVSSITLNNKTALQNVIITAPDGVITAKVGVNVPTNAALEYLVEIRTNVSTAVNYSPAPLAGITITQNSYDPAIFYVRNADLPNGDYRLFYSVRRTDGAGPGDYVSVGTANIPFRKATTNTYQLTASVNNPAWGSVSPTGGTYLASSVIQISATTNPYFHFLQWAGDITGQAFATNIQLTSNLNIQAVFAQNEVTNGTPEWWLAQFGLATDDAAALADQDGDGMAAWQEYIAGTNPTNQMSVLRITSIRAVPPDIILQWQSNTGRVYTVHWASNLMGGFQALVPDVPWPGSAFTDSVHNATGQGFYKIGAQQTP